MPQCRQCLFDFVGETCWNCGLPVLPDKRVMEINAKFLGIEDARMLRETPNTWTKAGEVS